MLLHRPVTGAPGARRNHTTDSDAQPLAHLDRASYGHPHSHLDQLIDLLADPASAQPDPLPDSHTVQYLDACVHRDAHSDAHGGLYALPDPFCYPNLDLDPDQYLDTHADLYRYPHRYLHRYTQPDPFCNRYTHPVAHRQRHTLWPMSGPLDCYPDTGCNILFIDLEKNV